MGSLLRGTGRPFSSLFWNKHIHAYSRSSLQQPFPFAEKPQNQGLQMPWLNRLASCMPAQASQHCFSSARGGGAPLENPFLAPFPTGERLGRELVTAQGLALAQELHRAGKPVWQSTPAPFTSTAMQTRLAWMPPTVSKRKNYPPTQLAVMMQMPWQIPASKPGAEAVLVPGPSPGTPRGFAGRTRLAWGKNRRRGSKEQENPTPEQQTRPATAKKMEFFCISMTYFSQAAYIYFYK